MRNLLILVFTISFVINTNGQLINKLQLDVPLNGMVKSISFKDKQVSLDTLGNIIECIRCTDILDYERWEYDNDTVTNYIYKYKCDSTYRSFKPSAKYNPNLLDYIKYEDIRAKYLRDSFIATTNAIVYDVDSNIILAKTYYFKHDRTKYRFMGIVDNQSKSYNEIYSINLIQFSYNKNKDVKKIQLFSMRGNKITKLRSYNVKWKYDKYNNWIEYVAKDGNYKLIEKKHREIEYYE